MHYYNYIRNNDNSIVHQLPIVGAYTVITSSYSKPFITLFYQLICNKLEHQNGSLVLPFQLMEHGISINLTLSHFNIIDGKNSTQSFSIEEESYPLDFDGRKIYVSISKPTQEDHDNLSTYKMTSSYPYNPDPSISQKLRCLNHKKLRTIRRKLSKLSESSGIPPKE